MGNMRTHTVQCEHCGEWYRASRTDSRYCKPAHQRAAHRETVKAAAAKKSAAKKITKVVVKFKLSPTKSRPTKTVYVLAGGSLHEMQSYPSTKGGA